ncbi:MAG: T9SS type A sorting domain-containing protein, partial [Bacteroidetes bacterium]
HYYTYIDASVKIKSESDTRIADAYEKIIYKNIYPHIDAEYVFHEKEGLKYQIVIHPGGKISDIKMEYAGQKDIAIDTEGNVQIETPFGNIIDHAPVSFYADDIKSIVPSSFQLNGRVVSYAAPGDNNGKTLIIDPWTSVPWMANQWNKRWIWNVGHDSQGNVYIHGPDQNGCVVRKYTPAGVTVWTAVVTMAPHYVADMAVDQAGNSYVSLGYAGASSNNLWKVSPAGVGLWSQASGMEELWALAFSCGTNDLIGAGHYMPFTATPSRIQAFDANSGALISPLYDRWDSVEFRSICVDPTGAVLGITVPNEWPGMTPGVNVFSWLTKNSPSPGLNNAARVKTGYNIVENGPDFCATPTYYPYQCTKDFDAIIADNCYVYTTDGAVVDKWDKATLAKLASAPIPGGLPTYLEEWQGGPGNSGIDIDSCGNVYVGSSSAVHKFSNSLTLLATVSTPTVVFAVDVNLNGEVLASGYNFVTSLASFGPCNPVFACSNLSVAATPNAVICLGSSVTLTASGSSSYSWSTGQTSPTIVVSPTVTTNYTVYDMNSTNPNCKTNAMVTVVVSSPSATAASTPGGCSAAGSATVTVSGATAPYTYQWSPSGGNNSTAAGLPAGNYTVTVTDAGGCTSTATVAVSGSAAAPAVSVTSTPATCNVSGPDGTATANATGGSSPYTYNWSNGQIAQTATGLSAGTYTVIVTDASGCTKAQTVSITQPPITPAVSSDPGSTVCVGQNVFISASGGISYSWNTGATTAYIVATPSVTTTYSVTITDASGCTGTGAFTVPVDPGCTATGISQTNTDALQVEVSPNPSDGMFNVQWLIADGNTPCIEVYNVFGEKVYEQMANGKWLMAIPPNSGTTIDLSSHPDGVYLLRISVPSGQEKTGRETFHAKIVIQK